MLVGGMLGSVLVGGKAGVCVGRERRLGSVLEGGRLGCVDNFEI